ncbi:MAG: relaxase/mobilization nuclease domain-containing protein [Tannerellaceae bacterium]
MKEELPNARSWNELKEALSDRDIEMKFKVSRTTREVQGVKFEYGGISFSGSKVSREFSYMSIDYQLGRNAFEDDFNNKQATIRQPREETVQTVSQKHSEDSFSSGLGLFSGIGSSFDVADAEANQEIAEILRKKKKAKRKRGMRL